MWDLWWGRFPPSTSLSPANHSTNCSMLIIILYPGPIQQPEYWLTCRVDSVSPHPKKLKQCHPAAIRSHSATRKRQKCFMPTSESINDEDRPSELRCSRGITCSTCCNIQQLGILSIARVCLWMSFGWLARKRVTYTSC
jgi:hypothetical protein